MSGSYVSEIEIHKMHSIRLFPTVHTQSPHHVQMQSATIKMSTERSRIVMTDKSKQSKSLCQKFSCLVFSALPLTIQYKQSIAYVSLLGSAKLMSFIKLSKGLIIWSTYA